MPSTLEQITQNCIKTLRQVSGVSVQKYAETHIAHLVQNNFTTLFDRHWWKVYMTWFPRTLDGVSGVITTNLDGVDRFEDIKCVFPKDSNRKLMSLPTELNPYTISGTRPKFVEATATTGKLFRVWPLASEGDVLVRARLRPARFIPSDTILLDDLLLEFMTCHDYAVSEGANPDEANRLLRRFEERYETVQASQLEHEISFDNRSPDIPTAWFESP